MECDHVAELPFHQELHCSCAEAGRQHAVETRWRTTALQVTEHDVSGFFPREGFEVGGDPRTDPAEPLDVLPAGGLQNRRLPTDRSCAFRDDDDAEPGAERLSSRDAL